MAKPKTLRPTSVRDGNHGRVGRWEVTDGVVEADRRGVYLGVEVGLIVDPAELADAIKAATLYHVNVKETE